MENPYGMVSAIPYFEYLKLFPEIGRFKKVSSMKWNDMINARDQKRGFYFYAIHMIRGGFVLALHREIDARVAEFAKPGVVSFAEQHLIFGPLFQATECKLTAEYFNRNKQVKITYSCKIDEDLAYDILVRRYNYFDDIKKYNDEYKKSLNKKENEN